MSGREQYIDDRRRHQRHHHGARCAAGACHLECLVVMPRVKGKPARPRGCSLDEAVSFYARRDLATGCLLWVGACTPDGYPSMVWKGRKERVSRLVLGLSVGDGLCSRHTCDNPRCVERGHLISGTQADNMTDKVLRGRQARGDNHGRSTLTDAQVRLIRSDSRSNRIIAEEYGVWSATVWAVKKGKYRAAA